jgi:hypothetical protein
MQAKSTPVKTSANVLARFKRRKSHAVGVEGQAGGGVPEASAAPDQVDDSMRAAGAACVQPPCTQDVGQADKQDQPAAPLQEPSPAAPNVNAGKRRRHKLDDAFT